MRGRDRVRQEQGRSAGGPREAAAAVPVFLHGLGKSLPKGGAVPVPFFCDVFVGEPLFGTQDPKAFVVALSERMTALAAEGRFAPWE